MTNTLEQRRQHIEKVRAVWEGRRYFFNPTTSPGTCTERYINLANYAIAALRYFIPALSAEAAGLTVRDLFISQEIAAWDLGKSIQELNVSITDHNSANANTLTTNHLYAIFHMASYQCIAAYLGSLGTPFVLLVNRSAYQRQAETFRKLANTAGVTLDVVDVEDRGGMRKAIRLLRQGYSGLVYVDGNAGVEGMVPSQNKRVPIRFMGREMYARRGIYELGRLTGLDIVPVESSYVAGSFQPSLVFYPSLQVSDFDSSEEMVETIYRHMEPAIAANPSIWEGWLYIYRFLPTLDPNEPFALNTLQQWNDDYLTFDRDNYAIIYMQAAGAWLMNRRKFSVRKVDESILPLLLRALDGRIIATDVPPEKRTVLAKLGCLYSDGANRQPTFAWH